MNKNKFGAILIVVLLAILSLGTVFFSKKGVDYQLEQLSELNDNLGVINYNSVDSSLKAIEGKVGLLTFVNDSKLIDTILFQLIKINEQFNDRQDFEVVTFVVQDSIRKVIPKIDSKSRNYIETINLSSINQDRYHLLARNILSLKNDKIDKSMHLLIDSEGVIRKYYEVNDPEEIRHLVRNVTSLLPKSQKADIKIKR